MTLERELRIRLILSKAYKTKEQQQKLLAASDRIIELLEKLL